MLYYTKNDSIYDSTWISKFINQWFFTGEKHKVEKTIYNCFFLIKKVLGQNPCYFFSEIIEKVHPMVGLRLYKKKKRKVTKITANPGFVSERIQYQKGIFWLARGVKLRKEQCWTNRLFQEFYGVIFLNSGNTLKKKKEYYYYAVKFKTAKKFKWKV